MREQIANSHRKIMIRVHQTDGRRDNAVAVGVGVVGKCHAVFILQPNQAGHRIRTRTIHADFPVVIHRHERERRVEFRIHDLDVQFVNGIYRLPQRQRRAAERVHTEFQIRGANRVHVHDVFQILNVRQNKIFRVRGRGLERGLKGNSLHAGIARAQQFVRAVLHPLGHIRVRRTAVRWIVFEAAIFRRIVRRRDDDAVSETRFTAAIECDNCV